MAHFCQIENVVLISLYFLPWTLTLTVSRSVDCVICMAIDSHVSLPALPALA